jgi:hypothetical protein
MDVHERIETDDDDDEEEEDSTDILLCATFVWDLMEEMIALGWCHSFLLLGGRRTTTTTTTTTTTDDEEGIYRCGGDRSVLVFDDYSYAPPFASRLAV